MGIFNKLRCSVGNRIAKRYDSAQRGAIFKRLRFLDSGNDRWGPLAWSRSLRNASMSATLRTKEECEEINLLRKRELCVVVILQR